MQATHYMISLWHTLDPLHIHCVVENFGEHYILGIPFQMVLTKIGELNITAMSYY